jgi:uncharacterized protein
MVVGVCRLVFHFPDSGSLKAKRKYLRRIIERVRAKFNAGISEVGAQDAWQKSVVGLVVTGNDSTHVQSMLDNITRFIEDLYLGQLINREVDIVHYNENEELV